MKTYYYVDFENTGNSWLSLIKSVNINDRIYLFLGGNQKRKFNFTLDEISILTSLRSKQLIVVPCAPIIAHNAADMELASYLGYIIATQRSSDVRHIILSNDKDYDPLIPFWENMGVTVQRLPTTDDSHDSILELEPNWYCAAGESIRTKIVEFKKYQKTPSLQHARQRIKEIVPDDNMSMLLLRIQYETPTCNNPETLKKWCEKQNWGKESTVNYVSTFVIPNCSQIIKAYRGKT